MLRQAKRLPPVIELLQPRRHPYKTFEFKLPVQFVPGSQINFHPANLVHTATPRKIGRPDLICRFCPSIKSFASIINFWAHLVKKHISVQQEILLSEIQLAAGLWGLYWELHSDGGKQKDPTMAKIRQAKADGFSWDDVCRWDL